MEAIEMEMKVASYGPSKTHWWPLSVQATPIEPVTQPATVDSSSTIDSDVLVAQSVSTYPVFDGGSRRDGDPIADVYAVKVFDNGACFGLADGCGWGPRSFKAASKAVEGFSEYVDRSLPNVKNVREAAHFLLRAICSAHDKIWDKPSGQKSWECGSTTFLAALLLKVEQQQHKPTQHDSEASETVGSTSPRRRSVNGEDAAPDSKDEAEMPQDATHPSESGQEKNKEDASSKKKKKNEKKKQQKAFKRLGDDDDDESGKQDHSLDSPYVLVCANIGDCKAFVVSGSEQSEVLDVTVESKKDVKDRCDPGGRIGPYLDGNPDTRNLIITTTPVYPGDKICIVSDGVHDNLDPETLGLPLEFSIRRNPSLAQHILNLTPKESETTTIDFEIPAHYVDNKAWEALPLNQGELFKTEYREFLISKFIRDGADTPAKLVAKLFDHCSETTKASRQYMEQNPSHVHPPDYVTYPGKMDHTTCIIYTVPGTSPSDRPTMSRERHVETPSESAKPKSTSTPTELPPRAKKTKKSSTESSSPRTKRLSTSSSANASPRHTSTKKSKSGKTSSGLNTPRATDETADGEDHAKLEGESSPAKVTLPKKSRNKSSIKNGDVPASGSDEIMPHDTEASTHVDENDISPSKKESSSSKKMKRKSSSNIEPTTSDEQVASTGTATAGNAADVPIIGSTTQSPKRTANRSPSTSSSSSSS